MIGCSESTAVGYLSSSMAEYLDQADIDVW
jgi:hypothetical protein